MSKSMNAIEVKDLSYSYGKNLIYDKLSFQVPHNTIFGVLGKNGVGKSTLINILMGYLKPNSGQCLVLGRPSFRLDDESKRNIALLFEGFISYDFFTIHEYESFLKPFYPNWKSDIYHELVSFLALSPTQKLSTLSYGQKSQVILASLFAQDAKLLIFDDYSMGLDAGYRRLFADFLRDYLHENNKTVVITSHVMSDMQYLLDQFLIVERGGHVYQSDMHSFMQNFHIYQLPLDIDYEQLSYKRIDTFKTHRLLYTFTDYPQFQETNGSFEDKFLGFVGRYEAPLANS